MIARWEDFVLVNQTFRGFSSGSTATPHYLFPNGIIRPVSFTKGLSNLIYQLTQKVKLLAMELKYFVQNFVPPLSSGFQSFCTLGFLSRTLLRISYKLWYVLTHSPLLYTEPCSENVRTLELHQEPPQFRQ
jgi:hypothetical protein